MAAATGTGTVSYLIHSVDRDAWDVVRRRAKADNLPIKTVIILLLEAYASGAVDVVPKAAV